jgi:hypothetical protein
LKTSNKQDVKNLHEAYQQNLCKSNKIIKKLKHFFYIFVQTKNLNSQALTVMIEKMNKLILKLESNSSSTCSNLHSLATLDTSLNSDISYVEIIRVLEKENLFLKSKLKNSKVKKLIRRK